jgi:putative transposase
MYLLRSFYALNCGCCALVVMDNLPAHKLTSINSMIESVGARVIYLSPYSPDFNPIEI